MAACDGPDFGVSFHVSAQYLRGEVEVDIEVQLCNKEEDKVRALT